MRHKSNLIQQEPDHRISEIGETSGDRSVEHVVEETPGKVAPTVDEKPKKKRGKYVSKTFIYPCFIMLSLDLICSIYIYI